MPVPGKMCGAISATKRLYHRILDSRFSRSRKLFHHPKLILPRNKNITPTGFGLADNYYYNHHTPSELSHSLCRKEPNSEGTAFHENWIQLQ